MSKGLARACVAYDDNKTLNFQTLWMQAYDDNQTQLTLDSFLSFSQRFAKIKSRRLQKAVAGITGVLPPHIIQFSF